MTFPNSDRREGYLDMEQWTNTTSYIEAENGDIWAEEWKNGTYTPMVNMMTGQLRLTQLRTSQLRLGQLIL